MMRLFGILFWVYFGVLPTEVFAQEVKMRDFDGDGRQETLVYYEKNSPIKAVADRDSDGFVETVYRYKAGQRDFAEVDLDKDGRPEQWTYSRNGAIHKWEQDRNGDGRPDLRTYYEIDNSQPISKPLFRQMLDNDFDGEFESPSGLTTRKPETKIPHSLAEALLS